MNCRFIAGIFLASAYPIGLVHADFSADWVDQAVLSDSTLVEFQVGAERYFSDALQTASLRDVDFKVFELTGYLDFGKNSHRSYRVATPRFTSLNFFFQEGEVADPHFLNAAKPLCILSVFDFDPGRPKGREQVALGVSKFDIKYRDKKMVRLLPPIRNQDQIRYPNGNHQNSWPFLVKQISCILRNYGPTKEGLPNMDFKTEDLQSAFGAYLYYELAPAIKKE